MAKVALGKALRLTDRELFEMAEITETDIQIVQQKWRRETPKWAANLLLARDDNAPA